MGERRLDVHELEWTLYEFFGFQVDQNVYW